VDRSRAIVVASALLALGCGDKGPPAPTVQITTELAPVCQGTISHAEAELARIEAYLELASHEGVIDIEVVAPEQIEEHCGAKQRVCVVQPPRRIYVSAEAYDDALIRELVHARIAGAPHGTTRALLFEGLAAAVARPYCPPREGWTPTSATKLLTASTRAQLGAPGEFIGGALLRYLIDTHGPAATLEFMAAIGRTAEPDAVRLDYLERFGSHLDHDLYAHWPESSWISAERAGCVAPELPREDPLGPIQIEVSLDCGAPEVRNDFADPTRGFVEWTMTIDEHNQGYYELAEPPPPGVSVWIESCDCLLDGSWTTQPHDWASVAKIVDPDVNLRSGSYRLRVLGPLGAAVSISLVPPCDYTAQNCAAGQQCLPGYGRCHAEVPDPGGLGEACEFWVGSTPLPCEAGLMCVGPLPEEPGTGDERGVCLPYCGSGTDGSCPAGQRCEFDLVCMNSCDPLAQDCESGRGCVPDFATGTSGCVPVGERGLLESCATIDVWGCASGLVCEHHTSIEDCHSPGGFLDWGGCCTPVCDPAADDPGCPEAVPHCEPKGEGSLGVCTS
jgi:hypothetical protein